MSLGCVNYVLACCTLVDHDYVVLHAPGCGQSLVILHMGRRSQPLSTASVGKLCTCVMLTDYEMLCVIYYMFNNIHEKITRF